jgi:hypothetical protein
VSLVREDIAARLVEVPAGWENGGDFFIRFDGLNLTVAFGDEEASPQLRFGFGWVRSFRFLSEASYDNERDRVDMTDALLSELRLPDPNNPSNDYYGDPPGSGKGPPRLFRLFHYKAGLVEVVASNWHKE